MFMLMFKRIAFIVAGTAAVALSLAVPGCAASTEDDAATTSAEALVTRPLAGGVALPPGVELRMPILPGTTAKITNAYGAGYHVGVDNASSMNQYYALDIFPLPDGGFGSPIVAPADGVVKLAGRAPGGWATCGNWVVAEHDFGDGHKYLSNICHMSAVLVSVGQRVHAGDVLGKIGCASDLGNPASAAACSPDRWGPHVHISIQRDASIAGGSYGGHATVPELMDGYSGFTTGMIVTAKGGHAGAGPCAKVPASGNGKYCGASRQGGFSGGDPTTLYTCTDGASSAVTCGGGCVVAPPGQDDHCGAGVIAPCAKVSSANNGKYCGGSRQAGFSGGDPSTLYTCQDGHATASHCAKGCAIAPAGKDDACK